MNDRQRRINRIAQALIDEHVVDEDQNQAGDDDFESIKSVSESSYDSSSSTESDTEPQQEQEQYKVSNKLSAKGRKRQTQDKKKSEQMPLISAREQLMQRMNKSQVKE